MAQRNVVGRTWWTISYNYMMAFKIIKWFIFLIRFIYSCSALLSHFLLTKTMVVVMLFVLCFSTTTRSAIGDLPGRWELLVPDAGIASMHTAVTRFNTVILLDRTNIGATRLRLPNGDCRYDPHDRVLKKDCYAHSAEFHPSTNQIRPLKILTDTWCSSGQFLPDGTLLQTGGDLDGLRKIRKFAPCEAEDQSSSCDWEELSDAELAVGRWYSTNQILPDGSVIIVGGRAAPSIEFYPPKPTGGVQLLPFLADVEDRQMDNLYPYVHLLPNGHLFIFANNKAILYDYTANAVLRQYPPLDGGPRNYPSAGSSVMLPLEGQGDGDGDYSRAVILVCGGAEYGAFIARSTDTPAHGSCGSIVATDPGEPVWVLEEMPFGRIMGDMVMLPTGEVVIINGAQAGTQGFESASNPCLYPLLYRPNQPIGLRFMTLNPGTIPRMYHATANLLPDGRILLAGSNPHYFYKYDATDFPTELRIEAFSPEYLSPDRANLRPAIQICPEAVQYGADFDIIVSVALPVVGIIEVNFASAPFATHSYSQGQRLVKLKVTSAIPQAAEGEYKIGCTAPPDPKILPPGYYMAFAVNQGVPSVARWIQISGLV